MKVVHAFKYRFPRIQIGLEHTQLEFAWDMNKNFEFGTYIYCKGAWFHCTTRKQFGSMKDLVTVKVKPEAVPKEIRTLCLIVT